MVTLNDDIFEYIKQEYEETLMAAENATNEQDNCIDLYLPEPKTTRTLLKLPPKIRDEWLKAIKT